MKRPGKAIWRTKDGDIPIVIIKYLGDFEGEKWYLVRGLVSGYESETGVAEKELIQKSAYQEALEEFYKTFEELFN